jgi:hypothetical protein
VETGLLKQGSGKKRRGAGNGYSRMPGLRRKNPFEMKKFRASRDVMRRRNSKLKAQRKPKNKGGKFPPIKQNKKR